MANNPDSHESQWVDERLNSLADANVEADATRGWAELRRRDRGAARRRRWAWGAATAGAVGLVLFALPWPRAAAQRLWDRLVLGRVAVIQANRHDLPDSVVEAFTMGDRQPWTTTAVKDVAEAERVAGFRPSLPPPGVLSGTPQLSVVPKVVFSTRPLKIVEIKQALAAVGASDITVPGEWEGTTLTAEGGPVVVATYQNDVEVMQSAAFKMTTPSGFPFGRFMEIGFLVFGRSPNEARDLGQKFAANPALVLHFPEHEKVLDVTVRSGQAVLVGNPDGSEGICLFWNAPGRLYIVSAGKMNQEQAVRLANAIP